MDRIIAGFNSNQALVNAPALVFDRIRKTFGSHTALADFSLVVEEGELFGLVGINGAGKTTLIKCLLDFATPDSGAIRVLDVPHVQPGARSQLAFLPERFLPPYYFTGGDFLQYMLALHGGRYVTADALAMFEALDLDARALELPVRSFSKGMTQKLGLAACLLSQKRLYIFDEPTSGLDPRARALLKRQFLALRGAGRTLFVTSHLLADVEQLCDRMAVLHGGTLRYVGTPAAFLARHETKDIEEAFLRCIGTQSSTPGA